MLSVTAAVIIKEDKILITQRAKEDKHSLKWEFPGGKLEIGETPEECLKREIMEELNLVVEILGSLGVCRYTYDSGEISLMAYKTRIVSGDMRLFVHNDAKWVKVDELRKYDFLPADIGLIHLIESGKAI